jgi:tetratricopeptide (TPR) repeat protein
MIKNCFCLGLIFLLVACSGSKPQTVPDQMQPGSAEYQANEGVQHLNEGRLDLAEKSLLGALKRKPQLVSALHALGLVYVYRRDFVKAINTINRLILVNPRFYDAYNLLGTIYTEQGNYEQAKEKLLLAANAEEYLTTENAFANLAVLEIKFSKYDAALRYAEKGLFLNRRFAPLYNLKGMALENMKEFAQALDNYDKALALLDHPDSNYLINSARVAAKLGDKKKALNNLELAMGSTQDPTQKAEIMKMIKQLDGG